MSGQTGYLAGLSAEDQVAARYVRSGCSLVSKRWRGAGGEIDLILRQADCLIFVEVKKSRSHARAAERVSQRQVQRIYAAASEFVATEPMGQDTEMRFDVALVDATGRIDILENAFGLL